MPTVPEIHQRGTRAAQPAATVVTVGSLYCVTDEDDILERSNGTTWESYSPGAPGAPAAHASSHMSAGGDPIKLDELAAPTDVTTLNATASAHGLLPKLSGSATDVLLGDGTFDSPPVAVETRTILVSIDGAGAVITTGVKGFIRVPVAATIIAWTLLADQAGDIVIDVWKDVFANYPPTDADSITNGNEPELSADNAAEDVSLGDWTTTAITAGDVLGFNVDSVATVTWALLELTLTVP